MTGRPADFPLNSTEIAAHSPPLPLLTGPGESQWFAWHGQRVHYRAAGTGPVLVLVHGPEVGGGGHVWRHVDAWLAEHYQVLIPDLPGYGLSDIHRGTYTADLYVRFFSDFLARVAGPMARVAAIGLSASYALKVAAERPSAVSRLVTVSPSGQVRGRAALPNFAGPLVSLGSLTQGAVHRHLSKSAIVSHLSEFVYAPGSELADEAAELREWVAARPYANYVESSRMRGLMNLDLGPSLRTAHQPVMMAVGRYLHESLRPEADQILSLGANAVEVQFSESGASPHEEEPSAFCRALLGFLESDSFAHVA